MRLASLAFAGLICAGILSAQDLPPGVLLISRVKNHIREESHRLSAVSCLETVHRERQAPKGKMRPLDTIRLDVLSNGEAELYASPGDRKFSAKHPLSYAGGGTLGNGLFGLYLHDIVLGAAVSDQYRGEENLAGRPVARYDFQVPALFSGQTIETPRGSGRVGLRGSFWVDPQTYDVVRLELNADDFPPTLPVTAMQTRIDYAPTRLANNLIVLLPQTADSRMVEDSGEVSDNQVEFTHCRVFEAESRVNFDAPESAQPAPRFGAASVDETLRPLPSGLQVTVSLRTPISGDLAVGSLIDGVVDGDVTAKHTLVIPNASPVRGRIRRLEHYTDPFPYFIVGLEFTEVEVGGIRHLFYADVAGIGPARGVSAILSTKNTIERERNPLLFGDLSVHQTIESLSLYPLPGVATFFFKGARLNLPRDFHTVWNTRALAP